jgi:uncharacterized protein VirK/YbjX
MLRAVVNAAHPRMHHLLSSLHHRIDWRGGMPKRTLYAIKYLARSLRHYRLHAGWLAFLHGEPRMRAMLAHDPRLLERPQHDYINRRLDAAARYAIIRGHYDFVLARFPAELVRQVYLEGRSRLGTLPLKDGHALALELRRPTGRGREGELALYLADGEGRALSSIVFTFADGGRSLLLGCLQGAAAGLGRDTVRELTRRCHGLRPKNLLLSMLLGCAERLGVERVRGVGNAAHPFAGTLGKIKADYDGFWRENDGLAHADGFYDLPAREPLRDIHEVDSKHRSAFRRREALREEATRRLWQALAGTPPLALAG